MRVDDSYSENNHNDVENQNSKENEPEYMCHIDLNDMNYSHSQETFNVAVGKTIQV